MLYCQIHQKLKIHDKYFYPAREVCSFNRNIVKYLRGELSDNPTVGTIGIHTRRKSNHIPSVKLVLLQGGSLITFPSGEFSTFSVLSLDRKKRPGQETRPGGSQEAEKEAQVKG